MAYICAFSLSLSLAECSSFAVLGLEIAVFLVMDSICISVSSVPGKPDAATRIEPAMLGSRGPSSRLVFQLVSLALWLAAGGFLTWLVAGFNRTFGDQIVSLPPWGVSLLFLVATFLIYTVYRRPFAKQASNVPAQPEHIARLESASVGKDCGGGHPRVTIALIPKRDRAHIKI